MYISVIIPTYNPNVNRLQKVIDAIKLQSIVPEGYECIIIDNNSLTDFYSKLTIPDNFRLVEEPKQGLTYARIRGISEAKGEIIVMVDDDNLLDTNYLYDVQCIFDNYPNIGAIGGKSIPLFEYPPQPFVREFDSLLALRDLGDKVEIQAYANNYPKYSPIGAGMAFRKVAIQGYIEKIEKNDNIIADRKGNSLSSSGDNDMIMEIIQTNWHIGYFPQLTLQHIIPQSRTTKKYLAKLNYSIQKSWVQFLLSHGLSPWQETHRIQVPLKKVKAWFMYKAWKNETTYINWRGACGTFDGLSKR